MMTATSVHRRFGVSLQGSLDAFALPDVLALLASTKKSGELYVRGDRSEGRVWMDQGLVVGGEAPRARTLPEVFFELLREEEGTFVFDAGAGVPDGEAVAVEPVLREVEDAAADFAATSATTAGDIDHLVEIPKRRRRVSDAPPEPEEPETPVRTLADARAAREAQQQLEDELLGNQEEIDAAMAAL